MGRDAEHFQIVQHLDGDRGGLPGDQVHFAENIPHPAEGIEEAVIGLDRDLAAEDEEDIVVGLPLGDDHGSPGIGCVPDQAEELAQRLIRHLGQVAGLFQIVVDFLLVGGHVSGSPVSWRWLADENGFWYTTAAWACQIKTEFQQVIYLIARPGALRYILAWQTGQDSAFLTTQTRSKGNSRCILKRPSFFYWLLCC